MVIVNEGLYLIIVNEGLYLFIVIEGLCLVIVNEGLEICWRIHSQHFSVFQTPCTLDPVP